MSAGIDYGLGQTNVDKETGIRYGVISANDICQAWSDMSEADYGEPTCPKCGGSVADYHTDNSLLAGGAPDIEDWPQYDGRGCCDFVCERCEHTLDSCDCFDDEPNGFSYEGDGYQCVSCLDNDVMVLKSPFYTFAQFCSPCVPGAGSLNSADPEGVKTYCLGHDWFDANAAPYPVYSCETGVMVEPEIVS